MIISQRKEVTGDKRCCWEKNEYTVKEAGQENEQ